MTATTAADDPVDGRLGLTAAQVAERAAAGRVNVDESSVGRSTGEIIRANVFTYFNGLIASLTVLVLIFGSPADALFGIIAVVNVVIGVAQELRAKKTLDSLAVLNAQGAGAARRFGRRDRGDGRRRGRRCCWRRAIRSSSTARCSRRTTWAWTSRCSPARPTR
ncbi:MAG: hypothetical protein R2690_09555 [Acidimicrobiales bacterium]